MKMWQAVVFILVLNTAQALPGRELMEILFQNYSRDVRPSSDFMKPVQLTFGISVLEIVDLDEKKQTFTISLKVKQIWSNYFLSWEPRVHGGIRSLVVAPKSVWLPDIVLYNNVHKDNRNSEIGLSSTRLTVHYDGTVVWSFPVIVKTKCQVDITYFPFDKQICQLKFGSWTFDQLKLNLTPESDSADTSEYSHNAEWALISVDASVGAERYKCCPELYQFVTYRVIMRRRSLYFLINLILPIILVVVLSVITFIIPIHCGERMKVAFALLLSMFEFLRVTEHTIPPSSDVIPLITYLFTVILLEMSVVVVVNCLIFQISFPPHRALPEWLKSFLRKRTKLPTLTLEKKTVTNTRPSFFRFPNPFAGTPKSDKSEDKSPLTWAEKKFHLGKVERCVSTSCRCYGRQYGCLRKRQEITGDTDSFASSGAEDGDNISDLWNTLAKLLNTGFSWFLGSIILATLLAVFLCAWPRYTS